jgi:hypothetical protein
MAPNQKHPTRPAHDAQQREPPVIALVGELLTFAGGLTTVGRTFVIVVQAFGWLRLGHCQKVSLFDALWYFHISPPMTDWIAIQRFLDWVSVSIFAIGISVSFVGAGINAAADIKALREP